MSVTATIDIKKGLGFLMNKKPMYLRIAKLFIKTGEAKIPELTEYVETENWNAFTIQVHAVKSTSATVGARELPGAALDLEQAGKNGDGDFIKANFPAFAELYKATNEALAAEIAKMEAEE